MFLKAHFPGLDLDSPEATEAHRRLIRTKPLLRAWYAAQYGKYRPVVESVPGGVHVELGSGGGFLKDVLPAVVTTSPLESDVAAGFADRRVDAQAMPFADASADSFFLLDVLHHLPRPRAFLGELSRTLKPGGRAVIIEPANTLFARFLYKTFHHESFDERAAAWEHDHEGNLSDANMAVPSLIFERDRAAFESEYPSLRVESVSKDTFLSYVLSGGLSYEPLLPAALAPTVPAIETLARPLQALLGTYMTVTLSRR